MAAIAFDKATREALAHRLVRLLRDEFDAEIAPMDGQRLVDVLSEQFGAYWYNQGLHDAETVLRRKADDIGEAIAGLQRALPARP